MALPLFLFSNKGETRFFYVHHCDFSFLSYKFRLSRTRNIGIAALAISVKSFIGQKVCSSEGISVCGVLKFISV